MVTLLVTEHAAFVSSSLLTQDQSPDSAHGQPRRPPPHSLHMLRVIEVLVSGRYQLTHEPQTLRRRQRTEELPTGFQLSILERVDLHLALKVSPDDEDFWNGTKRGAYQFDDALATAMGRPGPFVLEVVVDATVPALI